MNFKDKKSLVILLLILLLVVSIFLQKTKQKKIERILSAYEHTTINTYNYLMTRTDFKPAIANIEKLYALEGLDDKMLITISDSFTEIIDHLLQLNSLRGYSENKELLKENKNKLRNFSYMLLYEEEEAVYDKIHAIYTGFENLLMDMYQNGLKEKDKVKVQEIVTSLGQIEGTIKSSVNRSISPNALEELRKEFKRIEPLLDKIEKTLNE